jgi:NitT/TauT family transport system substrate-binding protein
VLNYILKSNGIDPAKDVTIEYKGEHTELATLLLAQKADIALLPEPFVTTVMAKDSAIARKLDLTQEWEKSAGKESPLAMGCLIVNTAFAKEHKDALDKFLDEYSASVVFVNEQREAAGELIAKYGIMDNAKLAAEAIPGCNIVYLDGADMKSGAQKFLEVLFEAEPKSIGGQIPDEGFYYQK